MSLPETAILDPLHLDHILVVDDEPLIREPLSQYLDVQGFYCETAKSGDEALTKLQSRRFALVIADIRMPGLNGLKLLEVLRRSYPDVAVIMITAVSDLQTAVKTMKQGASDYITKPFDLDQVLDSVRNALHRRLLRLEDRKISENLEGLVRQKSFALHSAMKDLEDHRDMTLEALVRALDAREHETQCHSLRVQTYTVCLAKEFGFSNGEMVDLARGALLHDIGKIGISDTILLKPGKLTDDEWTEMRKHPQIGHQILQGVKFLENCARMVLCHHERFDGSGYPEGLREDEIPLEARIFAVIDAYDAITTDRPYRKALPTDFAREELLSKTGSQFDPRIVDAFLSIPQPELDRIRLKYS